jgi:hypothetical protein
MESKLRELIGKPNVWLLIKSSNGWIKNVEILEVNSEIVTFRYEHSSDTETRVWEKTTRLENIVEIDVRCIAIPKSEQQIDIMRSKLTRLLEQE